VLIIIIIIIGRGEVYSRQYNDWTS